jgi:hypothetical protein
MAFVLLQHLDPHQRSLLSEIIARTTEMPVQQVVDGVAIAPNQVYVIPPAALMASRPRVPSASAPDNTTPMALLPRSWAKASKNPSIMRLMLRDRDRGCSRKWPATIVIAVLGGIT